MIRRCKPLALLAVTILSLWMVISCGRIPEQGTLVITETYGEQENRSFRLVLFHPEKKTSQPLTKDFFSARYAEVSYDGKRLLFTGKQKQEDPWQIWEMNLRTRKVRQVTRLEEPSTDPAYLPGGRMVFSRKLPDDSLKAGFSLFTCGLDGSDLRRITFSPHDYTGSSVLKDGRILTICKQTYPVEGHPVVMVLRPDGTKNELFYAGNPASSCRETSDGKILFTEAADSASGVGLPVAISYNRPLHSRQALAAQGEYRFVFSSGSGKMLVSALDGKSGRFALSYLDRERKSAGEPLYTAGEGDVLEVTEVIIRERPRKLPSEVDPGVKTGQLMCQNINLTGLTSPETGFTQPKARQIEVFGLNESMGRVTVEPDGSFYLKLPADTPFRIETLDSLGRVVNGPGGWYYLRPNERRGCAGCHEDQEIAPANRYALAVGKKPVTLPIHIENIKEKEVELE